MGLPADLLNARATRLVRPTRTGFAGQSTEDVVLFSLPMVGSPNAIYEPVSTLEVTALAHLTDARERLVEAVVYIDRLHPLTRQPFNVRPGDLLTITDENDVTHAETEVVRANLNVLPGSDIDHWELELSGV